MKLVINKKINANLIVTSIALFVALVAMIVYGIGVSRAGYFQGQDVSAVLAYGITGLIFFLLSDALNIICFDGIVGKYVKLVGVILKVVSSAFFVLACMSFVEARIEGIITLFFSNEEVLKEIQTADNMASADLAIASIVLLGLSGLAGIVSSFFGYAEPKFEK